MAHFKVKPATVNATLGSWVAGGGASSVFDGVEYGDSTKYAAIDSTASATLQWSVSAADNIYLDTGIAAVAPVGAGEGTPIAFADLPAGFTVDELHVAVQYQYENPESDTITVTIKKDGSMIDTVNDPIDSSTWYTYGPTVSPTPSTISTFFGQYSAEFTSLSTSGLEFRVDAVWIYGTYSITAQAWYMRCRDVEIFPGITAQVCDVIQQDEADAAPSGYDLIDDDPTFNWYTYNGIYLYQPRTPGPDWTVSGSAPEYGWWRSFEEFQGGAAVVSTDTGAPRKPRTWEEVPSGFDTNTTNVLGGAGGAIVVNNRMIYARGGYTVDTDSPKIGVFDGISDRILTEIPDTSSGPSKCIMSIVAAGGRYYVTTLDSGSSASDWSGRVFELDPYAATLSLVGSAFTGGEVPYALCWHNGRLWCGTNQGDPTAAGKIYWLRPDVDTSWTEDEDLSSHSVGGCTSLISFQGQLLVGTSAASGTFCKVLSRDFEGTYTTSTTASGGTAAANNAILAMVEFDGNLYASFWNDDTTEVAKVYKYTGSAWSTAYTGATSTIAPYVGLYTSRNRLYVVGGGSDKTAVLLSSTDGSTFSDLTSFLPGDEYGINMFADLRF